MVSKVLDGDEGSSISGSSRSSRQKHDVLPSDGQGGDGADEVEKGRPLETGLFGVLYTLSKERVDDSRAIATAKMLLDFLQQLVMLLGTQYGWFPWFTTWTASLTWMWEGLSYLDFAAKLSDVSYVLYEVALYGIGGLLALSLALCAYVGYCFRRHRFTYVWPVWFLRVVVSVFLQTFYVSAMGIFFVNINCHWLAPAGSEHHRGYMDNYPTLNCAEWPYVFNMVVAILLAFIFSAIVFVSTMADFEMDPRSEGLLAASHPKVEVINLGAKTVFLLASAILVVDIPKLQAIIFAFAMGVQFYTTVRWVPFMVSWVNHFRAGFNLCNTWVSVMMIVLRYTPSAKDPNGKSAERLTLITIAGLPCFMVVGVLVSYLRLRVGTRVAIRAFHSATPAVKPKDIYKFIDVHEVEVVARVCRQRGPERDTDDPEALKLAERVLKSGIALFPTKAYAHILYSNFLIEVSSLYQAGQSQLMSAKKLEPDWVERFAIFVREQQHMQRAHTSTTGESAVDLVSYVEFQRNYRLLVRATQRALASQQAFWKLLLRHKVHLTSLTAAFRSIENAQDLAIRTYRSVLERYPNSVKLLRSYARFQEAVLNNPWRAQQIYEKADQLEEQQASVQDNILLGNDRLFSQQMDTKKSAVAVINSSGIIQMTNKPLQKLFGYKASELEGQNVSILMPAPFSNRHNGYLAAYIATGQAKVIDTGCEVVALHRRRHVFPIKLAVSKLSGQGADSQFLGVIQPVASTPNTVRVWLMTSGMTLCVDELFEDMFGTSIPNCIGRPFKDLVLEQDELAGIFAEVGASGGTFTAVSRGLHIVHKYAGPIPVHLTVSPGGTPDEPLLLVSIVLRTAAGKGSGAAGAIGAVAASGGTGTGIGPLMVLDRYGGMVFANAAMSNLLGYAHKSFLLLRLEALVPEHYQALHACGVQELMRSRSRFACRAGQTIFMCSSNRALVPVRLSISHKAEGEDSGLLSVVQVAKCSVAAGLAERRVQFEVDWAGCITCVASQSGDTVSRVLSARAGVGGTATMAAVPSTRVNPGSAPTAAGGPVSPTNSARGASHSSAASAIGIGARVAGATAAAHTHLFGVPPEHFTGCNLFKLVPELGALAPDEDLQDDILEELRLMSLQRLSPVFLRATLLPAVAAETATQRAKDAAAAAAEEALALQQTMPGDTAGQPHHSSEITVQSAVQAPQLSEAHGSLNRSGAFSSTDVNVVAAAAEAVAAPPAEPVDVRATSRRPVNAFSSVAAAAIAAAASGAGPGPARSSLEAPIDAQHGPQHMTSMALAAAGALGAVKDFSHWRNRARTKAAGNRVTAATLAPRPVILEIDGTSGDANLVVSIWHPDKVASVLEVSREGDIRQAVLDELHPPGPVFGLTDTALQQYNLRELLQIPTHTSLEDYLFPIMAVATRQPGSSSRGGTSIMKRSALRSAVSIGPRATATTSRGPGTERGMVGAFSMQAGGGGRSSRRQATAQQRPQVGPARNAAMMHADGKPLHIVVQGIAKRGTNTAFYVRITLSQRTEDDGATGASTKGTLLSRLLGPGTLLATGPQRSDGGAAAEGALPQPPQAPVAVEAEGLRQPAASVTAAGISAATPAVALQQPSGAVGGTTSLQTPGCEADRDAAALASAWSSGTQATGPPGDAGVAAGRMPTITAQQPPSALKAGDAPPTQPAGGNGASADFTAIASTAAPALAIVASAALAAAPATMDKDYGRATGAAEQLYDASAEPTSSEAVRAGSDQLQPAVLSPGSAHEGESWDTGRSDAVVDTDELDAGLPEPPASVYTPAGIQPVHSTTLAQPAPAGECVMSVATDATALAVDSAAMHTAAASAVADRPHVRANQAMHASTRAATLPDNAAGNSGRRGTADQDVPQGTAMANSTAATAPAAAAAAASVATGSVWNEPATSSSKRVHTAAVQSKLGGLAAAQPASRISFNGSGGSASTSASTSAMDPVAVHDQTPTSRATSKALPAPRFSETGTSTHSGPRNYFQSLLQQRLQQGRAAVQHSHGQRTFGPGPVAEADEAPRLPSVAAHAHGLSVGGDPTESDPAAVAAQGGASALSSFAALPSLRRSRVSSIIPGGGDVGASGMVAADDYAALDELDEEEEAALAAAALGVEVQQHDAGFQRGRRLKRISHVLEQPAAQAAINRFWRHSVAVTIALLLAHTGCFAGLIFLSNQQANCMDDMDRVTSGLEAAYRVAVYTRALDTILKNEVDQFAANHTYRDFAAPVYTSAGLPVYAAEMSRQASIFEAQHFSMYADAGNTYGRGAHSGRALWDDRTYEVWTLLDATTDPPRFLRENLSLFELGNRFVMYARDIADNYRRLGPPYGNLSDSRGFRFIRDEVVPELLPGYFNVAENIIQGCVADQRLLNQVLLSLLVVEACCLCGAAVLYLLYRLVKVSKYQTSLFSVFLAIPSATVRTLTLRKLEEGEDDDDGDVADGDEDDLDAEDADAAVPGGKQAVVTLATAAPDGTVRAGSRAKLSRGFSRNLTTNRHLGAGSFSAQGKLGGVRHGAGADTLVMALSKRAGLRAAAFSAGRGAVQLPAASGALGSDAEGPGTIAGTGAPLLSTTGAAAAAAQGAPLMSLQLRSTRGRSISFRDHAPPGVASDDDGHGEGAPQRESVAPSSTQFGGSGRHQLARSGAIEAVTAGPASEATPNKTHARQPPGAELAGVHWSPPSAAAPSPEEGSPDPAGVTDGSSVVDGSDIVAELQSAAVSRQRNSLTGMLASKRLSQAVHATVSQGRSLGQRALAVAASGRRRVNRFTRQLLKRRSVMTGTNKILIANSLKDCWRLLPIVIWAILVISLYAYTYTISDWAMTPLNTVTIASFTIARNVRMVYFAHELCANNTPEAIAASKAQLNRTTALVQRDYATLLFGHRYEPPDAVGTVGMADAGYQVEGGHVGIARLGGRVGHILYSGLNPDGSRGNCLRPNASLCFRIGHPYAVPSLNGLDIAIRHSFEAAEALITAPEDQINIGNRFLDFLFKVTSNDVQIALLTVREYFDQQLHDAMSRWQAAHIGLYVATVVLFALFLVAFVRPFVRSTRDEAEHVANMLSDLPPEVDIIRLVEAALGVGDSGKPGQEEGKAEEDGVDNAGLQKDAAQMRAMSNWLDKAGTA
ncbi:hypothetical protein HYH02_005592 [Chlamydomonas schloesseri]|uniref:PAS domain-containing protein n=1 Tax=Chlamydomonas schloesseri TaxID=2026947 RepID=A0A835WMJ2_9CHLO|nr:hypothetical protein HYH02_005592 [Chlamydomonas schloesseri]|eukprot:KAG2449445.1 hypothetical protein HYH02_005592 [Chlamydomonas schloesseri]